MKQQQQQQRDRDILYLYQIGHSINVIGGFYNMSRQRIAQILESCPEYKAKSVEFHSRNYSHSRYSKSE